MILKGSKLRSCSGQPCDITCNLGHNTYHAFGEAPTYYDNQGRIEQSCLDGRSKYVGQRKVHLRQSDTYYQMELEISYLVVMGFIDCSPVIKFRVSISALGFP